VLHTIKTKTMRLDHNIHAASQLNIVTPSKPRVIAFLAILAALVGQKLVADRSDIMMAITVLAIGTEDAEDLEDCKSSR
jgi:xanthosine utilization system XapX-like protein